MTSHWPSENSLWFTSLESSNELESKEYSDLIFRKYHFYMQLIEVKPDQLSILAMKSKHALNTSYWNRFKDAASVSIHLPWVPPVWRWIICHLLVREIKYTPFLFVGLDICLNLQQHWQSWQTLNQVTIWCCSHLEPFKSMISKYQIRPLEVYLFYFQKW